MDSASFLIFNIIEKPNNSETKKLCSLHLRSISTKYDATFTKLVRNLAFKSAKIKEIISPDGLRTSVVYIKRKNMYIDDSFQ